MPIFVRSILAILAGIIISVIGLSAAEMLGAVVHPIPADFDASSEEQMFALVASIPTWLLAAFIPVWGAIAWLATWVAKRIGGSGAALVIGVLLMAAVLFNVSTLPYPLWFKLLSVGAVLAAILLVFRKRAGLLNAESA